MNTILGIVAVLASFWLALHLFNDRGEPGLGVVMVGVGLWAFVNLIECWLEDWKSWGQRG